MALPFSVTAMNLTATAYTYDLRGPLLESEKHFLFKKWWISNLGVWLGEEQQQSIFEVWSMIMCCVDCLTAKGQSHGGLQ